MAFLFPDAECPQNASLFFIYTTLRCSFARGLHIINTKNKNRSPGGQSLAGHFISQLNPEKTVDETREMPYL